MNTLLLLLLAVPLSAEAPQQAQQSPREQSSEQKIRSALVLCVKVGADSEGRKVCARALGNAEALAKKRRLAAEEKSVGEVKSFLDCLVDAEKLPAQREAQFDSLAEVLPVKEFKPSYAKYFPPPVPPASTGKEAAGRKGMAAGEEPKGKLSPEQQEALRKHELGLARALGEGTKVDPGAAGSPAQTYSFNAKGFPGFYKADGDVTKAYNFPRIAKDVPGIWSAYGQTFKTVGESLRVDPYALAAFCVFESYNEKTHNLNPKMRDGVACGVAATQSQDVSRSAVPGLKTRISESGSRSEACDRLRSSPEYSIRFIAQEFKERYGQTQDLAKAFPLVAFPAWGSPGKSRGNYGTQAEYVSRAYVLYQAFRAADGPKP